MRWHNLRWEPVTAETERGDAHDGGNPGAAAGNPAAEPAGVAALFGTRYSDAMARATTIASDATTDPDDEKEKEIADAFPELLNATGGAVPTDAPAAEPACAPAVAASAAKVTAAPGAPSAATETVTEVSPSTATAIRKSFEHEYHNSAAQPAGIAPGVSLRPEQLQSLAFMEDIESGAAPAGPNFK